MAYYGARGAVRSELSLSRAPFERYFDAYVPECAGANGEIVRVEIAGAEVLEGKGSTIDGLPGVIREVLDAWSYWLADREFLPADECLLISISHDVQRISGR